MHGMATAISLHQPRRLEFGNGVAARPGEWAIGCTRVFVVASPHSSRLIARRCRNGTAAVFANVPPEPGDTALDAALSATRAVRPDVVIGLGGGSVMDVAKLVAVLRDGAQSLNEVVGPNKVARKLPALAQVATTAGGCRSATNATPRITPASPACALQTSGRTTLANAPASIAAPDRPCRHG